MNQINISQEHFRDLATERLQPLLNLICCISSKKTSCKCLNRFVLRTLFAEATQIEEFLDFYGAKNNKLWAPFRSLIAAVKRFSDISYELLHIKKSIKSYRLLDIGFDFKASTNLAFSFSTNVLLDVCPRLLNKAQQLGLNIQNDWHYNCPCLKEVTPGLLPQDRGTRHVDTTSKTVTALATAFLNLSVEGDVLHNLSKTNPDNYVSQISDSISEKELRSLELQFHNLQSLYDTFVSDTDIESLDTNLPVLRGHISVVFHLLKTATGFIHYYERHLNRKPNTNSDDYKPAVKVESLLTMLMDYSITYASRYIIRAKELCQQMLRDYTEIERIEVPVPRYRGFHIRPSTLISKIVRHYGSQVIMELQNESYDAGIPLELFRANEKMNAVKRREINREIACSGVVPNEPYDENIKEIVQDVILALASQHKLLLYEQPLKLQEKIEQRNRTLFDLVVNEIARLQAIGKIDVETNLKAVFIGDKRVLADIKLLVENGYGEDNFGNNILLPEKLKYLRR